MRIYFTRHGESQANLIKEISNRGLKHGLTLKGRDQAITLADRLKGIPITRIYSSPVLRAIETTIILANRLGLEYEVTDALREYDCGILEGRSDENAWKGWQDFFDTWSVHKKWDQRIEGGESFNDVGCRFKTFIEGLVNLYGNTSANVVCVAHGGVYWMMLPVVLKNVDIGMIPKYGMDYTTNVVAEYRSGGLFCLEWNGYMPHR